jgi:hypothetical protein
MGSQNADDFLSNTMDWIECHIGMALHSATSSTATELEDLKGLPLGEEAVLNLLEGVSSVDVHGEEFLLF